MSAAAPQACKYTWGQGLHSALLTGSLITGGLYGHSRVSKYRNELIDEIAEKDRVLHELEIEVKSLRERVPVTRGIPIEAVAPLDEVESGEFNWDKPVESLLKAVDEICAK